MSRQPFPGTISAVEAQTKKRKHLGARVNVFIDDQFSFALDAMLAMQHGLRPDLEIGPALLDELLRLDGDARAYARALHFLSYRPRSEAEIRARLERDEWPEAVLTRTIERLRHEKLLNDAEFATMWVEGRSLSRPRGGRMLRHELSRKGVPREVIADALPDADHEIENAVTAARTKERSWSALDEKARREKMLAFLQRRGFNYGTARVALQRLQAEADEEGL